MVSKLCKIALTVPVASLIITSSISTQVAQAVEIVTYSPPVVTYGSQFTYSISQESSPGTYNFLGNIQTFKDPSKTLQEYYNWSGFAYHGPNESMLLSNTSHLFLVEASDGVGLFAVHGKPGNTAPGQVTTQFQLIGDTASFLVKDDPMDYGYQGYIDDGTNFKTIQGWDSDISDGVVIGSLNGNWSMYAQFEAINGLNSWKALSSSGASIPLNLQVGRRVLIQAIDTSSLSSRTTPEPTSGFGLLIVGVSGGVAALKRQQKLKN